MRRPLPGNAGRRAQRRGPSRSPRTPLSAPSAAIYGIGVDILRESRIEKIWARHGLRLADKILCESERAALAQARVPVRFLTKAFAIKEACVKALGCGFTGIAYDDIGSRRDTSGKPELIFSARLRRKLDALGVGVGHVSLSDEGGMVCAMVVLERRPV